MASQLLTDRTPSTRRWSVPSLRLVPVQHPVFILRPPYEPRDLRAILPDLNGATTVPGSIVCVQLSRPELDVPPLREFVRDLSQRAPSCPVAVLVQMSAEDGVGVAARLAPLGIRAVVPVGPAMPALLRQVLTDPGTLARDVIDWLQLRPIRLNPNQVHLLEKIFTAAPEHAEITGLLDHFRFPQSSARFRLQKRGLPSPSRWFQAARAIHAALRIQAQPDVSIASIANEMGFADHSALAHLMRRCLGIQAREVRGTLGWEWLLHRWITSSGTLTR